MSYVDESLSAAPAQALKGSYVGKRALDVAFVLLATPIILPLVGILALLVARDGGGAFYRQVRIGRGGRRFAMWKLRTMVPDAASRLKTLLELDPNKRAEWDRYQKLSDDPRVTEFGQFLRQTSLDELPQLWNVLVGDMSLVGPRPMLPEQQVLYPGEAYYLMRPGVTGPWQVAARNDIAFKARAGYDVAYLRALCPATDLRLILRTLGALAKRTGR